MLPCHCCRAIKADEEDKEENDGDDGGNDDANDVALGDATAGGGGGGDGDNDADAAGGDGEEASAVAADEDYDNDADGKKITAMMMLMALARLLRIMISQHHGMTKTVRAGGRQLCDNDGGDDQGAAADNDSELLTTAPTPKTSTALACASHIAHWHIHLQRPCQRLRQATPAFLARCLALASASPLNLKRPPYVVFWVAESYTRTTQLLL